MFAHKVAESVDYHLEVIPPKLVDLMYEEVLKLKDSEYDDAEIGGMFGTQDTAIRNITF